jgi:hypothetical protein
MEGQQFIKTTLTEVGCEDGTCSGAVSSTEERYAIVTTVAKQLTFRAVRLCVFCWCFPLTGTSHFQNRIGEEIKGKLRCENAYYHSVQNSLFYLVLSRNIIIIRLALQSNLCLSRNPPGICRSWVRDLQKF